MKRFFHAPHLRTYASRDVPGVECGGAIKNVIAIAAGAADGLGFGHNTRAMLITRGLSEMVKLSLARGGQAITLAGLAGMGDLVLTYTGELSRNRTVGLELGKGRKLAEIVSGLGHVAEGVKTTRARTTSPSSSASSCRSSKRFTACCTRTTMSRRSKSDEPRADGRVRSRRAELAPCPGVDPPAR